MRLKFVWRVPIDELAFYNETLHRLVEPGEFEIQVGHASDDIVFRKTIVVEIIPFSGRFFH